MLAPLETPAPKGEYEPVATAALRTLREKLPLPGHPGPLSMYTESPSVLGSPIHLAGVSTELGDELVCGSAAALEELPLDRAYFELLERLSVVLAMERVGTSFLVRDASGRRTGEAHHAHLFACQEGPAWRAARSNGVAVGSSWENAALRAHWELLERDRVLRSWYGEVPPVRLSGHDLLTRFPLRAGTAYEIEAYELGSDREGVVAGVFAFPRGGAPLVYGFAARSSVDAAVQAAARECVQRMGFLWGEPIPTSEPELTASPDYHQEFYLVPANHRALREWLRGGHARYGARVLRPERAHGDWRRAGDESRCADLTPPELAGQLWVAKAIHAERLPLVFGHGHPWLVEVPRPLAVHPVA